jgi:predicted negative regulator of RcsB-dependent stress response
MKHSHQAGRAMASLVLLLLVLVSAGGWNYYRNLQLEKATESSRPYKGYSDEDLQSLRAAYASELAAVQAQFDSAKRRRARPSGDIGTMAGNVEQFQRTTRASTAIRDAAANVADRQAQVTELDRELEIRSQFGEGFARHLKLLTTL